MARAGLVATNNMATDGKSYASTQEVDVLREYFTVPGAPVKKPYLAPWSAVSKQWKSNKSPGGDFQRQRESRASKGIGFHQDKSDPDGDKWALTSDVGPAL